MTSLRRLVATTLVVALVAASALSASAETEKKGWSLASMGGSGGSSKTSKSDGGWVGSIGRGSQQLWKSTTHAATSWWPLGKSSASKPKKAKKSGSLFAWKLPKLPGLGGSRKSSPAPKQQPQRATDWLAQERPGF